MQTIGTSGTLDLDLKVVAVSGRATKNGQPVPNGTGSSRGSIAFALAEGSERRMPSFESTGEATYQGELFAGNDVRYQPPSSCNEGGPLPCQTLLIVGCPTAPKSP